MPGSLSTLHNPDAAQPWPWWSWACTAFCRAFCRHCWVQVLRPQENGPAGGIRPGLLMPETMVYRNRYFRWWSKDESLNTQLTAPGWPLILPQNFGVWTVLEVWISETSESSTLATKSAMTSKKPRKAKSSMEKSMSSELHMYFL